MEIMDEMLRRYPSAKDIKNISHFGAARFPSAQVIAAKARGQNVMVFKDETTTLGGQQRRAHLAENDTVAVDAGNKTYHCRMESDSSQHGHRACQKSSRAISIQRMRESTVQQRLSSESSSLNGEKRADILEALLYHLAELERTSVTHHQLNNVFNTLLSVIHDAHDSKYHSMQQLWANLPDAAFSEGASSLDKVAEEWGKEVADNVKQLEEQQKAERASIARLAAMRGDPVRQTQNYIDSQGTSSKQHQRRQMPRAIRRQFLYLGKIRRSIYDLHHCNLENSTARREVHSSDPCRSSHRR